MDSETVPNAAASNIDLLQRPVGTMDILLHLLEHGPSNPSSIIDALGLARGSFYNCVRRLEELGFIFDREERGFPRLVIYGLTRAGEQAAEPLRPLAKVLRETIEARRRKLDAPVKEGHGDSTVGGGESSSD